MRASRVPVLLASSARRQLTNMIWGRQPRGCGEEDAVAVPCIAPETGRAPPTGRPCEGRDAWAWRLAAGPLSDSSRPGLRASLTRQPFQGSLPARSSLQAPRPPEPAAARFVQAVAGALTGAPRALWRAGFLRTSAGAQRPPGARDMRAAPAARMRPGAPAPAMGRRAWRRTWRARGAQAGARSCSSLGPGGGRRLLSRSGADIPAAMAKLSNSLAPPRATHRATSAAAYVRSRAGCSRGSHREDQGCKRPGRQRAADAARSAEIATPAKQPKQNHAQHAQNGPWPRRSSGGLPATQSIARARRPRGKWGGAGSTKAQKPRPSEQPISLQLRPSEEKLPWGAPRGPTKTPDGLELEPKWLEPKWLRKTPPRAGPAKRKEEKKLGTVRVETSRPHCWWPAPVYKAAPGWPSQGKEAAAGTVPVETSGQQPCLASLPGSHVGPSLCRWGVDTFLA